MYTWKSLNASDKCIQLEPKCIYCNTTNASYLSERYRLYVSVKESAFLFLRMNHLVQVNLSSKNPLFVNAISNDTITEQHYSLFDSSSHVLFHFIVLNLLISFL